MKSHLSRNNLKTMTMAAPASADDRIHSQRIAIWAIALSVLGTVGADRASPVAHKG